MRSSTERLLLNEPMSRYTRIGTGGPAALLADARTMGDVLDAALMGRDRGWPLLVLGKGSNLLVADEGYSGVVLKLGGQFGGIVVDHSSGTFRAGGGAALMSLGLHLARLGYPGFTYMGVIPGTVGGAVRMNAGVGDGQAIDKDFLRALALDPLTGETLTLEKKDMGFAYRATALQDSTLVILETEFRLPPEKIAPQETVLSLRMLLNRRHAQQPRCYRTFGSTFKNPPAPARSAGWYLDQAGMRGMRVGGAAVAQEHANWIINTGAATTADVLELMRIGRSRVFETFGIHLEEEVVVMMPPARLPAR